MGNEKVLIVEDERIIALDLQHRLEKLGFRVSASVSSGEQALGSLETDPPDAVLMDINLSGGMDGIQTALRMRDLRNIPVFFLTGLADKGILERAKTADPYGYLVKPFNDRELFNTIEMGLYKARLDAQLREQEHWMSALLQSAGEGIIACGRDGRIRLMNPAAERLTGWRQDEAASQTIWELVRLFDDGGDKPIELPDPAQSRPDSPIFFESVQLLNKLGERIHVQGSLARIREAGQEGSGFVLTLRDMSEIRELSANLSYRSSHDTLTGLFNREAFLARLADLRKNASSGQQHCLIDINLDKFRIVNDVCGHAAGDELLRQTATSLRSAIGEEAIIARLGGDEFGLLLPGRPVAEGRQTAQRLVRSLGRQFAWEANSMAITASAGLVPFIADFGDCHAVLAAAGDACRLAKEEGGNRIRSFESSDHHFIRRRGEMQWISRITRALEENRFQLYYQPLLPLSPGKSLRRKIEILLRLDEDGRLVLPGEFIPAAERYQLMPAIDRWVVRETFRFIKNAQEKRRDVGVVVCINLSGSSLADESLFDFISQQFFKFMLEPNLICFEITETAAIQNLSRAQRFINNLRQLGCTFALDDFGNGFSSFASLKSLPVDFLKIDGSYVKNMAENPIDFAMVEAVNNIGHVMGMQTIAEYVHNRLVQENLRLLGVDYAQGYAVGPPSPLSEETLSP